MGRIIKWVLILVLVYLVVVVGHSFLGDLSAPEEDVVKPVTIDVN